MQRRALIAVFAVGCVSRTEFPHTPNTGGPAIECSETDDVCLEVSRVLETRRDHIGADFTHWCIDIDASTRQMIAAEGPAAIPYLIRAYDDRDPEVAELAMRATIELGGVEPVADWCGGIHDLVRIAMCRRALRPVIDTNLIGCSTRRLNRTLRRRRSRTSWSSR